MKHLLIVILFIFPCVSQSDDNFSWVLPDGTPAPNTDSQKSIEGFGGWLLVTPDKDWEQKWNTPAEITPSFSVAEEVEIGEELTILPFYVNPKLNDDKSLNILCDVSVQKPDGSYTFNEKGIVCATGIFQGDLNNVLLASTIVKYIAEDGDLFGEWIVRFKFTDTLRNISVPLKTSFTLVKNKANKPLKQDK
jgi:hypothetical protein